MSQKLNQGFNIEVGDLEERIAISTQIPNGYYIIPLRGIKRIERIVPLKEEETEAYIKHIPLMSSKEIFPFKNAMISRHMSGPHGLHVPQTFILRSKLTSILEGLDDLYQGFSFPSLSKRTAHYVFGKDSSERDVTGIYFPPLIEIINGGNIALLFDGNHRMALCGIGAASETILIKGSLVSPPYTGVPWHRNFVDEKPLLKDRYVDFNPSLLKDFDYVGIDG